MQHLAALVRQRHLEQVVRSHEPWVVPFVVQLVGEYVVEILEAIRRGISDVATAGSAQRLLYGEFIARNPSYFARTERRVVSCWSRYYRPEYPAFGAYPGCPLLTTSVLLRPISPAGRDLATHQDSPAQTALPKSDQPADHASSSTPLASPSDAR